MHHHPTVTLGRLTGLWRWQAREPKAPAQGRGGGSRGEMCRGRNCLLLTGWYSPQWPPTLSLQLSFQVPQRHPSSFWTNHSQNSLCKNWPAMSCYESTADPVKEEQFEHCCSWPDRSSSCRHPVSRAGLAPLHWSSQLGWLCPLLPSGVTLHSHLSFWCQLLWHLFLAILASRGEGWAGGGGSFLFTFRHVNHCT